MHLRFEYLNQDTILSVAAQVSTANTVRALMLDTQGEFSELEQSLRNESAWEVLVAPSVPAFEKMLSQQSLDIALISTSDFDACNQCFVCVSTQEPAVIRVMLNANRNRSDQLNHLSELSHYCLTPSEPSKSFAEKSVRMIRLNRLVHKTKTREYVNSLGKLPSPPKVYQELSNALRSELSNAKQIGRIISEDPALTVKVLKVVNSAYFGLGRQISNIQEAVALLGIRTLRGLSISGQLLNQYPQHRNWSYFSFEAISKRSVVVARLAQQIGRDLKLDTAVADQAFIGGLLHDLGMLIFASQDSDSYRKVMVKSAQTNTHLCIVEKDMLGLFHGEIAAYLLTQWKLPPAVAEAVLLHHTPQLASSFLPTPLTAVHIADALTPDISTEIGALIGNTLNKAYIKALGLEDHIDGWEHQAKRLFADADLA